MKDAVTLVTTIAIAVLGGLFVWKGDSGHAMACVAALLPSAGTVASKLVPEPQVAAVKP